MDKFKYRVTSPFGLRDLNGTGKQTMHKGIDIVFEDNDNVISFTEGTVGVSTIIPKSSGNKTWEWGNYVRVDGVDGNKYYYCHMNKRSVKVGQKVKVGDVLGIQGETGYSFGVHVHFEVRNKAGASINPITVLKQLKNVRGTYIYTINNNVEVNKMADIIYTVVSGDTLSKIASRHKTTYQKLAAYNGIKDPSRISIGQKIKIPVADSIVKPEPTKPVPVTPVPPKKIDYPITKNLGNGDYAIIGKPEKIVIADLGCKQPTGWYLNCINGTFFNRATSKVASILAVTRGDKLVTINSWACHQWCGYPEGVLVAYKDGTFDTLRIKGINEVKKDILWAVGGLSLLDKYNPAAEGFKSGIVFQGQRFDFSDVLRKTGHSVIGVDKEGLVYLIYVKSKTGAQVNTLCKSLGLTNAVMLDGGSIASISTAAYKQNTNTKQSNIIQLAK